MAEKPTWADDFEKAIDAMDTDERVAVCADVISQCIACAGDMESAFGVVVAEIFTQSFLQLRKMRCLGCEAVIALDVESEMKRCPSCSAELEVERDINLNPLESPKIAAALFESLAEKKRVEIEKKYGAVLNMHNGNETTH